MDSTDKGRSMDPNKQMNINDEQIRRSMKMVENISNRIKVAEGYNQGMSDEESLIEREVASQASQSMISNQKEQFRRMNSQKSDKNDTINPTAQKKKKKGQENSILQIQKK